MWRCVAVCPFRLSKLMFRTRKRSNTLGLFTNDLKEFRKFTTFFCDLSKPKDIAQHPEKVIEELVAGDSMCPDPSTSANQADIGHSFGNPAIKLDWPNHVENDHDQVDLDHLAELQAARLAEWLDCEPQVAHDICRAAPEVVLVRAEQLRDTIDVMRRTGVDLTLIAFHPWVLAMTLSTLRPRLQQLNRIGVNRTTMPLLRLPTTTLICMADRWIKDKTRWVRSGRANIGVPANRLEYLARMLNSTPEMMVAASLKNIGIMTLELRRIDSMLGLMLEAGITVEAIRADVQLFKRKEDVYRERIRLLRAAGVQRVKTWMLRCGESDFKDFLTKRLSGDEPISKREQTIDDLSIRLICSREYAASMIDRHPRLAVQRSARTKQAIDQLLVGGIDVSHIRRHPQLLLVGSAMLKHRLKQLFAFRVGPDLLAALLCLESRHYMKALIEMRRDPDVIDEDEFLNKLESKEI